MPSPWTVWRSGARGTALLLFRNTRTTDSLRRRRGPCSYLPSHRAFAAFALLSTFATAHAEIPRTPVILISIDTLRADHLSAYGYRAIQTPHIDSYGTAIPNVEAQIPLTLPSHWSLFTSTYPFQNGIEENAQPVNPGAVTLASVLQAHGYRTAAFIGCVFLEREMGIGQGFDTYDSPFHFQAFSPLTGSMFLGDNRPLAGVREKRDGALVLRSASSWLRDHRGEAVFAFIHLFDLHKPYEPHQGRAGYDAEILYADELLGRFRKTLEETGFWNRSLVILLSDHGEGLGEHGEASHGYFIYESTLRVPLLIHWPAAATAQKPAGLIDVAPTILDWLHIPKPPSFEGHSLGAPLDGPVISETVHAYDSFGWSPLRCIRIGDFKYIEAPRPELYNLKSDPAERNNLAAKEAARASAMRQRLRTFPVQHPLQRPAAGQPSSPATQALLNSLGYLAKGPESHTSKGPLPDPKDRLPEFHLYEKSQVAMSEGRPAEAVTYLRAMLAKDSGNMLARRDLGSAYLTLKDYAKASQALEQVLAIAPADYVAQFELGLAEERRGRLEEAERHLGIACRIAPAAIQCQRELESVRKQRRTQK